MAYFWVKLLAILAMIPIICKSQMMSCKYGERGSLTAYCTNVIPSFFRATMYNFDHLDETLICRQCNLSDLAEGTFDIPGNRIKNLDLYNSNIKKVSGIAFIGLIFMEKLILSGNSIGSFDAAAFDGTRKIREIYMNNALTAPLPNGVFKKLGHLSTLFMDSNNLDVLQKDTFQGLDNLEYLDLSYNRLFSLNNSLLPLKKLEILDLDYNDLVWVRDVDFAGLDHLLQVNVSHNRISILNFTTLDNNIRVFDLSHNNISVLSPHTFERFHRIEILYLDHNHLNHIPPRTFLGMYNLRQLVLSNNNLETFRTGLFNGLPSMQILNVSNNNINKAVVTGRLALIHLHVLDLSNNAIPSLDFLSLLNRAPRLFHVNILNNSLDCESKEKIASFSSELKIQIELDRDECPYEPHILRLESELESLKHPHSAENALIWVLLVVVIVLVGLLYLSMFYLMKNF